MTSHQRMSSYVIVRSMFGVFAVLLVLGACTSGSGSLSLGTIANQQTTLGESATVAVDITDADAATVTLSATSSNQAVVANSGLAFSGAGASRSLSFTPSSTTTGSANITLTARNATGRVATRLFSVQVLSPFGAAPTQLVPDDADPVGSVIAMTDEYLVVGGDEYVNVFRSVDGEWEFMQELTASDPSAARFGSAVAVDGATVIVGARNDAQFAIGGGAAYLFELVAGAWVEVIKLTDPLPAIDDAFGMSVAIEGSYAAVGAIRDSQDGIASGSVFMYEHTELSGWSLVAKLRPPVPEAGDQFGSAVAMDSGRLVVGSPGDPLRGAGAGTTHVYALDGFIWDHDIELAPAVLKAGDRFGSTVAISGQHVLVGAPNDAGADQFTGAAYAFLNTGSTWQPTGVLFAENQDIQDFFGGSIDLDYPYAVVGSAAYDEPEPGAGEVTVFRHDGTAWHQVARLSSPSPAAGAGFGSDVGVNGAVIAVSQFEGPQLVAIFQR